MDSESGCMDRYFRNVSPQRLILYGVIVVGILVVVILVFTLTLTSGGSSGKSEEFVGHDVLKNVPLVDGYNNLPALLLEQLEGKISAFTFDQDLSKKYDWLKTDIPRLKAGMVGCQVWAVKPTCTSEYKDAVASTLQQLDAIIRLNKKFKDQMTIVENSDNINQIFKEGKIGSILSIDGGHSIDHKLSVLRLYYRLGVRSLTLTSECDTPWASSYTAAKPIDLTKFGESIIKEINRLGIMIDLWQSSVTVQKKVLGLTAAPVLFSTSSAYNFGKKSIQIQDDILELIKKKNGLVMITFNPEALKKGTTDEVTLEYVVEQINYIRTKIGVDYVGIGSGFGISNLVTKNLEDSSKYPALFDRLAKSKDNEPKWGKEELEKLASLNFIRVFSEVEKVRDKQEAVVEENIPSTDLANIDKQCYTDTKL